MKNTKNLVIALILSILTLAAAPSYAQSPNWTGAYIGANFESGAFGMNVEDGDVIGGAFAGYDYDLGIWVVGIGMDVDFTNLSDNSSAASLDRIWRLKLRGGYKLGNGLLYATGGFANLDVGVIGDDDGYFIGLGYEHQINPHFSISGEVLYHHVDNFGPTPFDVEVTTYQIRGAYRF